MKKIYLIMILFFAIASGVFAQTTNIVTLMLKPSLAKQKHRMLWAKHIMMGKGLRKI